MKWNERMRRNDEGPGSHIPGLLARSPHRGWRLAQSVWAMLAFQAIGLAQEGENAGEAESPLVTDRPDFTESTEPVPTGRSQIEMGYTFAFDREGDDRLREHTAPELLLRVGVSERLELRFGWEGYSWSEAQSRTATRSGREVTREAWFQGAHDLSLGLKYKFVDQHGSVPHLGVIAQVSVPSGSAGVSSGDVEPAAVLLWAYDLSDRTAVAGNIAFATLTEEGDRFFQAAASLSGAYALTDRLGIYVEYFGLYPNREGGDSAHSINGGLTYLIDHDLQVDCRVGAGLNEEADDFFAGAGVAWRF